MADSVEQLYKAQDLQEKLYPITKENAVKDNSNVSLDTKLTSINTSISNKVDKVTGKGLSTNDYTSAEKTKLAGIEDGAQVNIIESIELNGESQPIENKTAKIDISSVLENLTSGSSLKLYAQETLTDQEFLYRQSPTEEDGNAKITDIKGNTLVWNQLVQNGNFASTNGWASNIQANTITASSNELTVNINTLGNNVGVYSTRLLHNRIANHKYLFKLDVYVSHATTVRFGAENEIQQNITTGWNTVYEIVQSSITSKVTVCYITATEALGFASGETYKIKNYQCFDLTQMGLDISSPSEFTSLFPKPYYDYNQGSLLSFNGSGIKTVGKNLFDFSQFANGTITFENGVLTGNAVQFYTAYRDVVNNGIELKYPKNTQITISFDARTEQNDSPVGGGLYFTVSENGIAKQLATTVNNTTAIQHITVTIPSYRHIDKLGWSYGSNGLNIWHITNFQVEFGTAETSYEPYTSSTLSLPISTYFPNGMNGVGTDYDELTNTKASTRMTRVDLGSLNWTKESRQNRFNSRALADAKVFPSDSVANAICDKYITVSADDTYFGNDGLSIDSGGRVNIHDTAYTSASASDFKTAMSGVYLVYPLATPTETTFTTALEMRYPAYAGGTEQILPENSSIPTTAPIVADIEYSYDFKAVDRIIGMLNSVAQNETSPSTHNYSVGDYLVYNYQLYKVIASISTGASLTVGTNIQATTIMNELASLS